MKSSPLTILITGASSGFGEAAARALSAEGHRLILVARRASRLKDLANQLSSPVHIVPLDITDPTGVKNLYSNLPSEFQNIDILINNAGLARGMETADKSSLEDWDTMVATNITGLIHITNIILPTFISRHSGLIINVGSVSGHLPYKGSNVYGATKAFVRQFSRNLRTDLQGTGIRVTNIEPGMAETEFSVVRYGDAEAAKNYYKGTNPLAPVDIARTISWVIEQPHHVNIDNIEIWPLDQTYGGASVTRTE